jgi:peroxiredoxin
MRGLPYRLGVAEVVNMRKAGWIAAGLVVAAVGCHRSTPSAPAASTPATAATPAAAPAAPASSNDEDKKVSAAVAALVGTTPPEWQADRWMNSTPRTLASLRGSVVLVRWWTSGCPFCSATAPSLREFHRAYGPRGLQVIGMYHWKDDGPFDPRVYEDTARKYGFTFPVAFDPEWKTLKSWMRDKDGNVVDTGWTSVTFVLDKHGVVRHVHPGGQYVEGDRGYGELKAAVERLLAEP